MIDHRIRASKFSEKSRVTHRTRTLASHSRRSHLTRYKRYGANVGDNGKTRKELIVDRQIAALKRCDDYEIHDMLASNSSAFEALHKWLDIRLAWNVVESMRPYVTV